MTVLSRQIDGGSAYVTYSTYDPNGNLLTESDNGPVHTYVYDSNDRRVRAYDPVPFDANYVEYTYDYEGHLLARRDQSGNTANFVYTNRGQLAQEIDPSGVTVVHEYDLDDSLLRTLKPGTSGESDFSYDTGGRQSGQTVVVDGGPNDIATSTVYDGNGNVVRRIDGEGFIRDYVYDSRNRPIRSIDPPSSRSTPTTSTTARRRRATRVRTGQCRDGHRSQRLAHHRLRRPGRVMREIDQLASTAYTHDVLSGGLVGVVRTDRMGRSTSEYYDGTERLVQTKDELNHVTSYLYSLQNDLLQVEDARGHATNYTYDTLGRCETTTLPELGDTVTRSYQPNGLLAERIDQAGNHTLYDYDPAGRLVSVEYENGLTDTYTYDAGGRLSHAHSGLYDNTVHRNYDRADRVVGDSSSGLVHMSYDRRSLETSITTPSDREFDYAYTARGEVDTIRLGANTLVDDDYDAGGRLVQRAFGNGTATTWDLDPHGWVKSVLHARGAVDILRLTYSRDGEGCKLRQNNLSNVFRNETYSYDLAGRLVSFRGKVPPFRPAPHGAIGQEKGVTKIMDWVLDEVGNWSQFTHNSTHEVRTHSDANMLVGITPPGTTLVYDKRGNLVDDGVYGYSYDYNDRLNAIRRLADDDPVATYSYDALGRRLVRTFLDKSIIAMRRVLYYYAGDRIVEMGVQPNIGDPVQFLADFAHDTGLDHPVVEVRPTHTYSFHADAGGDTVALTDENGDTAERQQYNPTAARALFTGEWSRSATSPREESLHLPGPRERLRGQPDLLPRSHPRPRARPLRAAQPGGLRGRDQPVLGRFPRERPLAPRPEGLTVRGRDAAQRHRPRPGGIDPGARSSRAPGLFSVLPRRCDAAGRARSNARARSLSPAGPVMRPVSARPAARTSAAQAASPRTTRSPRGPSPRTPG